MRQPSPFPSWGHRGCQASPIVPDQFDHQAKHFGGRSRAHPFGPFDQQCTMRNVLEQAKFLDLVGMLDAVQIDVQDRQSDLGRVVRLHDRERRARRFALQTERFEDRARQRRLASAKRTRQADDIPGA